MCLQLQSLSISLLPASYGLYTPNVYDEILTSHGMALGGGILGLCLGQEWSLMNGISTLIKEIPQTTPVPLLPCEDTAKRWPPMNQELGSPQTLNLLVP